jgi:SAM-dependent methyltransferase
MTDFSSVENDRYGGDKNTMNTLIEEKYKNIPGKYYKYWLEKNGGVFENKKVMDYGCGQGISSLGLIHQCGCNQVVGVDIGTEYNQLPQIMDEFLGDYEHPGNLKFRTEEPNSNLGENEYDVIVSWSVMEHVSQEIYAEQVKKLISSLKPKGFLIIQVAPLYYSPFGSHLFEFQSPWEHLYSQNDLLEKKIMSQKGIDSQNMINCFKTLNKFLDYQIIKPFIDNGCKLLDKYETEVDIEPPADLLNIYKRDVLIKEQILFVCQK